MIERKWLGSWLEVKPTFIKTTTTVQKQVEAASVVNYVVKRVIRFGLLLKVSGKWHKIPADCF